MKNKIVFIILIGFSTFLINCKITNAATKYCNTDGSVPLCAYENDEVIFKITSCYNSNENPYHLYFYFPTNKVMSASFSADLDKIKSGSENFLLGSYINPFSQTKSILSDNAYKELIKAAKKPPTYGDKSSDFCPKKIYVNKKRTQICITDDDNFCETSDINADIIFDNLVKTDAGDSDNVKKKRESNNYDADKYETYNRSDIDIGNLNCDSLLGRIDVPGTPAYYLDYAMSIIKYLAIIFLIVFSALDYLKAVVSKDDDMLSKANGRFVTRLITCIIIFFSPILINLILSLANIVDTSASCSIGGL